MGTRLPIDLNADLGERPEALHEDRVILRSLTSANIACGFHAGDTKTMHVICEQAAAAGVSVGAHVSYLDREGFGRRVLEIDAELLSAQVLEQVTILGAAAIAAGSEVLYVKPHGALYNRCAHDTSQAAAVAAGVVSAGEHLKLLCPPGSALAAAAADCGLEAVAEGFADRAYLADGSLAPRGHTGAVLTPEDAIAQALAIALEGAVSTLDGGRLRLPVRSICLHSDTPGADALAARVRQALADAGATIEAFA